MDTVPRLVPSLYKPIYVAPPGRKALTFSSSVPLASPLPASLGWVPISSSKPFV